MKPIAKQPELAHRAASGAMWSTVEMASTQLISLLIFAIMARFVTPTDFGLISVSYLAIYTFKSLVIDTVVFGVVRKQYPSDLDYTTSFWLTVGLSAVAALVTYLSAGPAERWMNAPHLRDVLRAMSIILLFMGLARTHEMRLSRLFQFRALALRGILGAALGGGIGIAVAMCGYSLTALVVQQISTSAISLALLWVASPWRPAFRYSHAAAREILLFMRTMVPATALGFASQYFDTFLVAYLFGPGTAGIYAVAKRLKLALQTVAGTPISGVIFSTLAEVQNDPARLNEVSHRMLALISFLCASIFVGASSISRQLVSVGFGERWEAAAPIFAVLAFSGLLTALQNFCETIFMLKHRQTWTFYILLSYMLLASLLFLPIERWGPNYLAIPFVIPYLIVVPVSAVMVSKLTGMPPSRWLSAILPSVTASGVMFVAVKLIESNIRFLHDLAQVAICAICGAIIYLGTMMILSRGTVTSTFRTIRSLIP